MIIAVSFTLGAFPNGPKDFTTPCTVVQRGAQISLERVSDGLTISIQPDGSMQTRPAGTAGPWELFVQGGNFVAIQPNASGQWGADKPVYAFPFVVVQQ